MRRHFSRLLPAIATALLAGAAPAAAQTYAWTHFAGTNGGPDALDGTGTEARFSAPNAAAYDPAGNLYVADTRNHVIRRVTPSGVVTTLAGLAGARGSRDGAGGAARFDGPSGIAADLEGNLYVADRGNATIRKIAGATGVVTTLAGRAGRKGAEDGIGSAATFLDPAGLAADAAGNVYVAEPAASVVRKVTREGVVTTFAGSPGLAGSDDGEGREARFDAPRAVATDRAGNVYVADERASTIRKVTTEGTVTTLAGEPGASGKADGTGSDARFRAPGGIAVDGDGVAWVADTGNGTIRRVSPAGAVTTFAGSGAYASLDGAGLGASFARPLGVARDAYENLLVTEEGSALRRVTPAGVVTTLAGRAPAYGDADAPGPDARFRGPYGVATSPAGNLFVADRAGATIRKVTPAALVTTVAGSGGAPGYIDGPVAQTQFDEPSGIAVDAAENVYVADRANNVIRRVSAEGYVSTLAGDPYAPPASVDGAGTDARFARPVALAFDGAGRLWVLEESHAVRRVTTDGVVTTVAGSASEPGSADGPAASARFRFPSGVAFDAAGNAWIADTGNATIRKVSPSGVVTTVAGVPQARGSADGVGPEARFDLPVGIAFDPLGRALVTDAGSHTIRVVTASRAVTTLAGAPGLAGSSDGNGAAARFNGPTGLAVSPDGRVYVADGGNAAVRVGRAASLLDAATIDAAAGLVGQRRQLDTSPRTATRWRWQLVRKPSGSGAELSAADVRNPTFTPDVADVYVFRLTAEAGLAASVSTVTLSVGADALPVESVSRLVPIVLDVRTGSAQYATDLALTNNTSSRLDLSLRYTASLGSKEGSGDVTDSLAPGEQRRIGDVLAWLREKGLPLPPAGAQPQQGGSLLVTFRSPAAIDPKLVSATARTTARTAAPQPAGRAGLAYSGLLDAEAATSSVTLYGLRATAADRTNVAVFNTSEEPVTVSVTVCSGTGDARCVAFRAAETLPPLGWVQYGSAELLDANGIANGWATVTRTSTSGSFSAYAVVNDNATNDGSYLTAAAVPGSASTLTVPVLVETPAFRSELVLANATDQATTFAVAYVESLNPGSGAGGTLLVPLRAREQRIIPEAIDFLRANRVAVGPKGAASYGGSLTVTVPPLGVAGAFAGARTAASSPAGGQFGLFTPSLDPQQQAFTVAYLYGLRADAENRTNVAVVNAGNESDGPVLLQLQACDGDAGGAPRGEPLSVVLQPGQWAQPDGFFRSSGVANGWVKVTRMSGEAPWIAYAVVNDGASPGQRTGDGAYVPMVK